MLGYQGLCENFGSWHPGTCNFVLCDGSVVAISVQIDLETLHRLMNRDDGQMVSLP
jgi:prepilin-type processing-associated H-X9-DG protein